jgi:hypothetical protein
MIEMHITHKKKIKKRKLLFKIYNVNWLNRILRTIIKISLLRIEHQILFLM